MEGGGPVRPAAAPSPADATTGEVVAAILNRTSGGIAAFESGFSGVILFSDGVVVRIEGLPWGPRDRTGSCPTTVQAALDRAGAQLGANWTVDCAAGMVSASSMGALDADTLAAVQSHLDRHVRLDVPPNRQESGCCDRVFTTRLLTLAGMETYVIDEQQAGEMAPVSPNVDAVVQQLVVLGAWVNST